MSDQSQFKAQPQVKSFAAELQGVDLTKEIDDETFKFIHDSLMKYKVIFFRDQDLSPQNHRDLALKFGEAHPFTISLHSKEFLQVQGIQISGENQYEYLSIMNL